MFNRHSFKTLALAAALAFASANAFAAGVTYTRWTSRKDRS